MAASVLGLLLMSGVFFNIAQATNYVGRYDGEWDTCTTWGTCRMDSGESAINMYVGCDSSSCSNLTYSSDSTFTSLQYNPDEDISNSYQIKDSDNYQMWFQTAILAKGSNNCIEFTIQIYDDGGNTVGDGGIVLPSGDSPEFWTSSCYTVDGAFLYSDSTYNAAVWSDTEYTNSNGYVDDVCFYVDGGGYSGYGDSGTKCEDPITYYSVDDYWLRSNLCLCGVDSGNTTFTGGAGQMYINSDIDMYTISPPIDPSTKENSNMEYGCFTGNGSNEQYQYFGLSDEC